MGNIFEYLATIKITCFKRYLYNEDVFKLIRSLTLRRSEIREFQRKRGAYAETSSGAHTLKEKLGF